jgi:transcriptional regulator with XRE-family HTH domain
VAKARLVLVLRSVAANVRSLRTQHGLTQEALAEAADLDLTYVQRVERAAVNLSLRVLVSLANALQTTPDLLLAPAVLEPARRGRPRKPGVAS